MKVKKKIICPICKGNNYMSFWAMRGYKLYKCIICEMVWDQYPVGDIKEQYNESYFINDNPKGGYSNYFEGMVVNRKTFYDRLNRIKEKIGGKKVLLDIGCALGDCLIEAQKLGWSKVEGLEVSDYACKFARKRGLKVSKGTILEVNFPKNKFDVVMIQDVIEHTADPLLQIEEVYKTLKPGGVVFIITPDIGGIWSKIMGSLWYHYKPSEHLVYFSQKTIKNSLARAGFINVEAKRASHVMSVGYILDRMRYYCPNFFSLLLNLAKKKTLVSNLHLRMYTGELEAWGQKPI